MIKYSGLIVFVILSNLLFGQNNEEFKESLQEQKKAFQFRSDLILLDSVLKTGSYKELIDYNYNSKSNILKNVMKEDSLFNMKDSKLDIELNFDQKQKDIYFEMEQNDQIPTIKQYRSDGKLKLVFRGIASEIEGLPERTGNIPVDNEFYLSIIKKLCNKNKIILKKDHYTFPEYLKMEESEGLTSEFDTLVFRSAFISFLQKHYSIRYEN